ncbi:MAG: pyruvate kinase, partial [Firmicutes bacterium]|nr:pyruvate kinase [Bacillota bacterium]
RVSVSYKNLPQELEEGSIILVNDGLVKFEVESRSATELNCRVIIGGKLSNRKSMSFPGKVLKQPFLSDADKADLLFGIKNDVDFVAASFVSTAQDMIDMRSFLDENGGEKIQIIAKIENRSGVDCAADILDYCEGLMVARGDLGVEIPYVEVPAIQKRLINLCRRKGGISVTATEMLESMINNPRPTRAEISDVANAVFDGSSVIMLSGESAMGSYPAESVAAMAAIAEDAERNTDYERRFREEYFELSNLVDALSHSACQLAIDTGADCIVACTKTGSTGRMVSRFRAPTPIIGMTSSGKAYRQLDLSWNVVPVLVPEYSGSDELFAKALDVAKQTGLAGKDDIVVVTGGLTNRPGESKLIYMDTVK